MDIKRNTLFFIDKEGTAKIGYKPDGKLRLRIRFAPGKVDFNVGYRVDLSKWSTETQRCKAGTTHGKKKIAASEINKEIQRLETLADNIFKSFEVVEHIPTIEEYRDAFNEANGKLTIGESQSKVSFFDSFDKFVKERGSKNDWTKSTYTKFSSVKKHLIEFDKNIQFNDWTETKLTDYVNHLRIKKNMRNSTIDNQLDFVKWFLRWGIEKGYNSMNAFEYFKPKLKSTEKKVIFLTWDELMNLKDFDIPETKKYLDRVRDVFCFCCFTGLRYSDVYNLKRSDIKEDHIEVTTVKTADSLTIELNNYSRAILNKYKEFHFEKNKALPVISNQKMNVYLKELGELVGIDEPIRETYYKGNERIDEVTPKYALLGTHAGRRTFICNALSMGIPAQTVMKWTGHSDYKAMKPYIDVADKDKQEAMSLWDKKESNDTDKILERLKDIPKDKLIELLNKISNE